MGVIACQFGTSLVRQRSRSAEWASAGGPCPTATGGDPWACNEADVPFFFKQWGGRTPKSGGRELAGITWDQMPPRLHVTAAQ
ncbi:DUF5131 family protein [Streptomyces glaucescens]|uniref:DUF5131 family protein n=1 Tax=Streptomyces glaucescens TaxID=1907 RepID=UPI00344FCEE6